MKILVVALVILFIVPLFSALWIRRSLSQAISVRGDVLFVFAHPDDEAMFFTPLLTYFQKREIACHFLCLSTGNYDGKGETRSQELVESAAYFGIRRKNVKIVDHPELQDGMNQRWPSSLIMQEVEQYLKKSMRISTVITFDKGGISGHPNHIAVHEGVKKLKNSMPPGIAFRELKTRNLIGKYIGIAPLLQFITVPQKNFRKSFTVIIDPASILSTYCAMRKHHSQLVWFRYLSVVFSTYSYLNEYVEIQ